MRARPLQCGAALAQVEVGLAPAALLRRARLVWSLSTLRGPGREPAGGGPTVVVLSGPGADVLRVISRVQDEAGLLSLSLCCLSSGLCPSRSCFHRIQVLRGFWFDRVKPLGLPWALKHSTS